MHPHGVILELSGQIRYIWCHTGAYLPHLAMEMIILSQVCYSFHYSVERYCTCSIGHYSCVVHRDKLPVERCSGFDRPISQDYSVDCYVEIVVCLLPDYSLRLSDHPYGMTMGSLGRVLWVRGVQLITTLWQTSWFLRVGPETMFTVDLIILTS